MKIIILAAGKGERLMPLTRNTPKPLLVLGDGKTLLEEQMERIHSSGLIHEVVIVTGYLGAQIDAKMATLKLPDLRIRTVFNPFYEHSNNLISMWLARYEMDRDFLITNGDNLFDAAIFREFAEANPAPGIHLSVNRKSSFDDDDMKVTLHNGIVARVSKKIPAEEAHGESPGLALIRGPRAIDAFIRVMDEIVRQPGGLNLFWLEAFNLLHEKGIPVQPWLSDFEGRWQELDFHPDVSLLNKLLVGTSRPAPVP